MISPVNLSREENRGKVLWGTALPQVGENPHRQFAIPSVENLRTGPSVSAAGMLKRFVRRTFLLNGDDTVYPLQSAFGEGVRSDFSIYIPETETLPPTVWNAHHDAVNRPVQGAAGMPEYATVWHEDYSIKTRVDGTFNLADMLTISQDSRTGSETLSNEPSIVYYPDLELTQQINNVARPEVALPVIHELARLCGVTNYR